MSTRYEPPGRIARTANTAIRRLAELGISIAGTQALAVYGRKTGKRRVVVVNLLTVNDRSYVVAPRGNTEWVRNAKAAGIIEIGPRWRTNRTRVAEVADADKPDLLRRYLDRWYWQVKGHVAGLTPNSSYDELRAAAPSIPILVLDN
jgi:hypothetical protein